MYIYNYFLLRIEIFYHFYFIKFYFFLPVMVNFFILQTLFLNVIWFWAFSYLLFNNCFIFFGQPLDHSLDLHIYSFTSMLWTTQISLHYFHIFFLTLSLYFLYSFKVFSLLSPVLCPLFCPSSSIGLFFISARIIIPVSLYQN